MTELMEVVIVWDAPVCMAIRSDCEIVTLWLWLEFTEVSRVNPPDGGLMMSDWFMVKV